MAVMMDADSEHGSELNLHDREKTEVQNLILLTFAPQKVKVYSRRFGADYAKQVFCPVTYPANTKHLF